MVHLSNRKRIDRNELLFNPMVLDQMVERHGSPLNIKLNVQTTAKQYEIRTAIRYWFGGKASHRTSDGIWDDCKAFDDDMWELDDNNGIVPGPGVGDYE
jgi:hypothetical protein